MLRVLLSVDTELWPLSDAAGLDPAIDRHVHGRTPAGDFGLDFQARLLQERGLVATFFVEALHSLIAGDRALKMITEILVGRGQDVQLHAHSEWLVRAVEPELKALHAQNFAQLDEGGQGRLLGHGKALLSAAGAPNVEAFRAGNFGADNATLRALKKQGFVVDSSYNQAALGDCCFIDGGHPLFDATMVQGLLEIPVTCFEDGMGHLRPLQICAASFEEMKDALEAASEAGRQTATIYWHGAELIGRTEAGSDPKRRLLVRRYERLLDFLAEAKDQYRVVACPQLARELAGLEERDVRPVSSRRRSTVLRLFEQVASRWI